METVMSFELTDIDTAMNQFTEDDWKAEAAEQGEQSVDEEFFVGMPWSEMVYRIETHGFTTPQAEYGADNCGVDWMLNAANDYINNHVGVTPDELSAYLTSLGYGKAEIINVLDYYMLNGGGVWDFEAEEYANYLSGSVIEVDDMIAALTGHGFTSEQAWTGIINSEVFNQTDFAIYDAQQLLQMNTMTRTELIDTLKSFGYPANVAEDAADYLGVSDSDPKG